MEKPALLAVGGLCKNSLLDLRISSGPSPSTHSLGPTASSLTLLTGTMKAFDVRSGLRAERRSRSQLQSKSLRDDSSAKSRRKV